LLRAEYKARFFNGDTQMISNVVAASWKCSGEAGPRQGLNGYDWNGFDMNSQVDNKEKQPEQLQQKSLKGS